MSTRQNVRAVLRHCVPNMGLHLLRRCAASLRSLRAAQFAGANNIPSRSYGCGAAAAGASRS